MISLLPKAKVLPQGLLLACLQLPEDGLKGAFALYNQINVFCKAFLKATLFAEFLNQVDKIYLLISSPLNLCPSNF